jgi:hypothetical protein
MVREEAVTILRILKAGYPQFYKGMSKEDATDIVELWAMMFDEPLQIVTEAVRAIVATKKDYPPTIADVKEKISLITKAEDEITEIEAWNIVKKKISCYATGESFESLPDILQKLVGSAQQLRDWGMMDVETLDTVVQSNFMRSYKAKSKVENEYKALPASTKLMIGELSQKFKMLEG